MIIIGIVLTVITYKFALIISRKTRLSILNPTLVSAVIIVLIIANSPLTYEQYDLGAAYITKILGPIVVVLAVPLYNNKAILKKYYKPVIIGVLTGVVSSLISVILLGLIFSFQKDIIFSLFPKSITTPMAVEVSSMIGGIRELTAVFVAFTGIVGAAIGPIIFKLFGISNDIAKGIALGAGSHGLGTSKAVEISEEAGSASGLSMGLSGIITIVIAVIFTKIMFF